MKKRTLEQAIRIVALVLVLLAGASNWFDWFTPPIRAAFIIVGLLLILVSRILAFQKAD